MLGFDSAAQWGTLLRKHHSFFVLLTALFALFVFSLISYCYFGLLLYPDFSHQLFASSSDSLGAVWVLNWWSFSFTHHLNLFYTYKLFSPYGYNLAQTESMPLLGFLLSPFIKNNNLVELFNIVTIFSSTLSAFTAFLLCRYISRSFLGALFGGFLFGFSSYAIAQSLAHLCLIVTFLIPLIALVFVLFIQQKMKPYLFIILSSFLLSCEFYMNQETGVLVILMSGIVLICGFFIFYKEKQPVFNFTKYWLFSIVITLICISPILYYFFLMPKENYIKDNISNSLALGNFFIPTSITWLGSTFLEKIHQQFPADIYESGGYFGIPVLFILCLYIRDAWKNPQSKLLISSFFIITIFSLGIFLHIFNHKEPIPLPWIIFNYLPIFTEIMPARLILFSTLLISIIASLWFRTTKIKSLYKYALCILSIIFLFPNIFISHQNWVMPIKIPRYFMNQNYKKDIPYNGTVIILASKCQDMLWQVKSHMWFTLLDGCTGGYPPEITQKSILTDLEMHRLNHLSSADFKRYLKFSHVHTILIDSTTYSLWENFFLHMGYSPKLHDGMYVISNLQ